MNNIIKIIMLSTFIFFCTDVILYFIFTRIIFKNNKNNKNLLYIYYFLMGNWHGVYNDIIYIGLMFGFYFCWLLLFIIVIKYILNYKLIYVFKKYNYFYLFNMFICIIIFKLYYGSYIFMKMTPVEVLLDKYLTPEEKIIYEKMVN